MDKKPLLYLLFLKNWDIFDQLILEEGLLRLTDNNFCIFNEGSPKRIVMGISGKAEKLVDFEKMKIQTIPIIKRYSGGGTVVVDTNTLFVSFILEKAVHSFGFFPEPILHWSADFYKKALHISAFDLKETDYVINGQKCGGNAQYIKKDRFVHHTTFLWDFDPQVMSYLLYPQKTPKYRQGRSHIAFLEVLKKYLPSKRVFFERIRKELERQYEVKDLFQEELDIFLCQEYRVNTCLMKETLPKK